MCVEFPLEQKVGMRAHGNLIQGMVQQNASESMPVEHSRHVTACRPSKLSMKPRVPVHSKFVRLTLHISNLDLDSIKCCLVHLAASPDGPGSENLAISGCLGS